MWRIRINQELSKIYKTPDLVADIRRITRRRKKKVGGVVAWDENGSNKGKVKGKAVPVLN
jgi:hypothetical protein